MRKLLLASTVLATLPAMANAQNIHAGNIGGMPYQVLMPATPCTSADPCGVVTYLGYQDASYQDATIALQNYFAGDTNLHAIVIAPTITASQDYTTNWGGYAKINTPEQQQMVAVVQGVEAQMGDTVNLAGSVVTGGSLGGDGTQAALIAYGPKGTVQPGIFSSGVSFDAATYAAAGNAQDIAALCGVPLTAVHGTADTNQSVTYDQNLAAAINGNPACNNSFTFVPVQGAGHGTWGGPSGYPAGTGSGTPLGTIAADISATPPTSTSKVAAQPVATPASANVPVTPSAVSVTKPAADTTGATSTTALATASKPETAATSPTSSTPATSTSAKEGEIIVPGSGSVTDCSGNVWAVTSDGTITEAGKDVPGGGGTSALTLQGCTVYGKDSGGNPQYPGAWFTMTSTDQSADQYWMVSAPPAVAISVEAPASNAAPSAPVTAHNAVPAAPGTHAPAPAPAPGAQSCPAVSSGSRDPTQTPFASTSVFNMPLGSGAQWTPNAQLAGANVYVNTAGNYNENIYTGTASDPLVTVTNSGAAGSTPGTYTMHIPTGAVGAGGNDQTFSVDDTTTHTWYGMGGFNMTGPTTATVSQASAESDAGSGIQDSMSNWDEGVGTLRQSDLQAGKINHMLRLNLPAAMLNAGSSTTQLVSNAWPQTAEDGFALNGKGGPAYSGTIPFGVTIGIPMNAVEPADVAANQGANMLWHALHDHGAMIRDQGGSAPTATFQADQTVNPNDPLLAGMEQFGSEIMAQTQILANQGPNSINGGGTPVVPLDPEVGGGNSASATCAAPVMKACPEMNGTSFVSSGSSKFDVTNCAAFAKAVKDTGQTQALQQATTPADPSTATGPESDTAAAQ